tara:strand:- start:1490 stop:1735 length:246 start_codon:yes stop_codon:yes gene_type:complete
MSEIAKPFFGLPFGLPDVPFLKVPSSFLLFSCTTGISSLVLIRASLFSFRAFKTPFWAFFAYFLLLLGIRAIRHSIFLCLL